MSLDVGRVDLFERSHFSPDHPVSHVVHDGPPARVMLFSLESGQQVVDHRNQGEVHMLVLSGGGWLHVGPAKYEVQPGQLFVCPPGTPHGFGATERMMVMATIIPSPQFKGVTEGPFGC